MSPGTQLSVNVNNADERATAERVMAELASKDTANPVHADYLVENGLESLLAEHEPPAMLAKAAQRFADTGSSTYPAFPSDPLGKALCPARAEFTLFEGNNYFGSAFGFVGALLRWAILTLAISLPDKSRFATMGDARQKHDEHLGTNFYDIFIDNFVACTFLSCIFYRSFAFIFCTFL